jgi:hypothetical protein
MKTIHIVVLDYSGATVTFYKAEIKVIDYDDDNSPDETELVEAWLSENTPHQLSNCNFMFSDNEIDVLYE